MATSFVANNGIRVNATVATGTLRPCNECLFTDEVVQLYSFRITVANNTRRVLTSVRFSLDLRDAFFDNTGMPFSPNAQTATMQVYSSWPNVNVDFDGVQQRSLLRGTVSVPPGCSVFIVTLSDLLGAGGADFAGAIFTMSGFVNDCACASACRHAATQFVPFRTSARIGGTCLPNDVDATTRTPPSGNIVYVVPAGGGEPMTLIGDGRSWSSAYVGEVGLRWAFATAAPASEIRVANGTYALTQPIATAASDFRAFGGLTKGDATLNARSLLVGGGSGTRIVPGATFAPLLGGADSLFVLVGADNLLVDGVTLALTANAVTVPRAFFFDGTDETCAVLRNVLVTHVDGVVVASEDTCGRVVICSSTFATLNGATDATNVLGIDSNDTVGCFSYVISNVCVV